MHTWQLLPSRFYFFLIVIINLFCGFELCIYLYRGYWGHSCLYSILLYCQYRYALIDELAQVEKIAGRWIFTTIFGEQLSCQKLKILSCSTYAIVLLIKIQSGKKRVLVVFSDQYCKASQHLLRWHLFN